MMTTNKANSRGLTWIELIVILGCCFLLLFLFTPRLAPAREKARRVNCLANLNGLHKGLASWTLDPDFPDRPPFPSTNMHSALNYLGISPNMFICPTAAGTVNRSAGISPTTNTAILAGSNCNYNYWTLRTEEDGDKILVCDRNGLGNASNAVGSWGGNHDGLGGNMVKVAGEGKWAGTNDILALDGTIFNLSSNATAMGVVTNN